MGSVVGSDEIVLDLFEQTLLVRLILFRESLLKLFEQLALILRQFLRHLHVHMNPKGSTPTTVQMRDAQTLQPNSFTVLGSFSHANILRPIQSLDLQIGSKG